MTVITDQTPAGGSGKPVEDRDIPIGFVGKNQDYGKSAIEAMTPKYKPVLAADNIHDFVDKLKKVETIPRAVFIGPIYPAEEQDELQKLIDEAGILCHVIKTNPVEKYMGDLVEQSKDMPELEKVGWITRQMFDRANIE